MRAEACSVKRKCSLELDICMQQLYFIGSMINLYFTLETTACRHPVIDDINMKRKTVMMRDKVTSSRKSRK
jgi:hypothetical protein